MNELIDLRLVEVVGSSLCLASDDGQKVHDTIVAGFRDGKRVRLSFAGVEALTSAFLNVAVGQLYGESSEEEIRAKLSVGEASQDDLVLLKRVVDRAKEFFRDPKQFQTTAKDLLGEDGEP
jgi:hypothetical protein